MREFNSRNIGLLFQITGGLLFTAASGHFSACLAQGSLMPPGPPGATMLTLSQVEPRTPIMSLPFTITNAGSYYLTANLTGSNGNGITIEANNVTLDLRGFSLIGTNGAESGIWVPGGTTSFILENGTVSGWPLNGVDADDGFESQFSQVNCIDNGSDGLRPGGNALLRHCIADGNGNNGFGSSGYNESCVFDDCDANNNVGSGFFTGQNCVFQNCDAEGQIYGFDAYFTCTFDNCVASSDGTGFYSPYSGCVFEHCNSTGNDDIGILAGDDTTIRDSASNYNGGDGIDAGNSCVLAGCNSSVNGGGGIEVSNNCTLTGCVAYTNELDNIATLTGCALSQCSAGNSTAGSGFVLGSGNSITACSALGNAANGIDASDRTTINGCATSFNGNAGVHIGVLDTVRDCTCVNNGLYGILEDGNGDSVMLQNNCSYNGTLAYSGSITAGAGIWVTNSAGCRIEGNTVDFNNAGLVVAPGNRAFILRNTAEANIATSFVFGSGNSWGPIVDASAGGDISTIANSTHPDANFIH